MTRNYEGSAAGALTKVKGSVAAINDDGLMPDHPDSRHETCVTRVPIFTNLDADAQAEVATFATPRTVAKGQSLYHQGDRIARLFIVHEGSAKLSRTTVDGHEQVVRTIGPGDVVGEHSFLTGSRPDHGVEALEPMTACVFDHADLGALTARHPRIAVEMLRVLSQRLVDAEQRVTELASTDVTTRLANYLIDLAPTVTDAQVSVTLPLTKHETASYLGTTPESFSRSLRKLEQSGLIEMAGRTIWLRDLDGLDKAAGGAG